MNESEVSVQPAEAASAKEEVPPSLSDLTQHERMVYQTTYGQEQKSLGVAVVLALLLGGLGAHRFYLNEMAGCFYALFFWTLIPSMIALIECLVMRNTIERHNKMVSNRIIRQLVAERGEA